MIVLFAKIVSENGDVFQVIQEYLRDADCPVVVGTVRRECYTVRKILSKMWVLDQVRTESSRLFVSGRMRCNLGRVSKVPELVVKQRNANNGNHESTERNEELYGLNAHCVVSGLRIAAQCLNQADLRSDIGLDESQALMH